MSPSNHEILNREPVQMLRVDVVLLTSEVIEVGGDRVHAATDKIIYLTVDQNGD